MQPSDLSQTLLIKLKKKTSSLVSILRANQRQISLVDLTGSDFKLSFGEDNDYVLVVDVIPYIWNRWWSYLIYLIIVFYLIKFFISQYKSIQEAKNSETLSRKELDLKRKQLASLSHELRTPLNAIIGITDATTNNDPDILHIKSSAYLLHSLINNALDSVTFETEKSINITKIAFNIKIIVEDVIEILNLYIISSNINVSLRIESSVPELIYSDKTKIQQIILNLLKNALKHSKTASSIDINIFVVNHELLVSVNDDGIGIGYPEQKAIFDVFYKIDNKNSGFGLGLYISKLLSKALGGDLFLDSELGKGSTFSLKLPIEIANEISITEQTIQIRSKLKIKNLLILEDDPLNIYTIKLQLKNLGIDKYKIVDDYNQYTKENKLEYDCIILDLNFNHDVYDGIDLAKILKNSDYPGLIYILTAESDALIKKDAKKYVTDYLVKPISLDVLESILFSMH